MCNFICLFQVIMKYFAEQILKQIFPLIRRETIKKNWLILIQIVY